MAAARQLFEALDRLNAESGAPALSIGFSLFDLRKKKAFDVLNNRTECYIRGGPDGKTRIRGETEAFERGKVRICPTVKRPCRTLEALKQELAEALGHRAVGSSRAFTIRAPGRTPCLSLRFSTGRWWTRDRS